MCFCPLNARQPHPPCGDAPTCWIGLNKAQRLCQAPVCVCKACTISLAESVNNTFTRAAAARAHNFAAWLEHQDALLQAHKVAQTPSQVEHTPNTPPSSEGSQRALCLFARTAVRVTTARMRAVYGTPWDMAARSLRSRETNTAPPTQLGYPSTLFARHVCGCLAGQDCVMAFWPFEQ